MSEEPVNEPGPMEHLVSLILEDGSKIDFSRTDNKEIRVCHGDHCVVLPKASGQVTLDFLALLEPFGKFGEESEDGAA